MEPSNASIEADAGLDAERQQYYDSWVASWRALQRGQLEKYRVAAQTFMEQQYTCMEATMTNEMSKQMQHVKRFLVDSSNLNHSVYNSAAFLETRPNHTQSDEAPVAENVNPDKQVTLPMPGLEAQETKGPDVTIDGVGSQRKLISDEAKDAQLKSAVSQLRTLMHWKSESHPHKHVVKKDYSTVHASGPVHHWLISLTNHTAFQVVVSFLIVSNTVVIALEADLSLKNSLRKGEKGTEWADYFDYLYTPAFTLELILRALAMRWAFVFGESQMWNLFDVFVVGSALMELCFQTFNLTFLRVLRIFRMLKILRIIRVFKVFRDLRLMVSSITSSMLTLLWAFVLMSVLIFIYSVIFVECTSTYLVEGQVEGGTKLQIRRMFSSLPRTMFTLLALISGGAEWVQVELTLQEINGILPYVLLWYIIFVYFGILNVLTSVFVDKAMRDASRDTDMVIQDEMDREQSLTNQLCELFKEVDKDESGTITFAELQKSFDDPRVKAYFAAFGISLSEASGLFNLLDVTEQGSIHIEEFIVGCMRLKGHARSVDLASLLYDQKKVFMHQSSYFKEIMERLQQMSDRISDDESQLAVQAKMQVTGSKSEQPLTQESNNEVPLIRESKYEWPSARQSIGKYPSIESGLWV